MITKLNQNSSQQTWDKYNRLFTQAWTDLKDRKKLDPKDKDAIKFRDLAHYLSYIEELITIDANYIMLPIDEAPFTIDADTRMVEVPPKFKQCSGVQNDNYCEIITFVIDRFFDYKDLIEADIAVQWINANGKEGVSFIQLKDYQTYRDKNQIRFGWPLTAEMTEAAGDLIFSVRFYTYDKQNKKFNYALNTIPNSIPIQSSLSIDFNGNIITKDKDIEAFKSFVKNSSHPGYDKPTRVQFISNPESLPRIDSNKKIILSAQATTKDENPLTYVWKYQKLDNTITTLVDDSNYDITTGYILYDPVEWPKEKPNMDFWIETETNTYRPFLSKSDSWPETKPTDNNIYERCSRLTIPESTNPIVGTYWVEATNTKGSLSETTASSQAVVMGIGDKFKIETDLPNGKFLSTNKDENVFHIQITSQAVKPDNIYTLYYNNVPKKVLNSTQATSAKISFDAYGEYYITVKSSLNKTEKTLTSNKCTVYGTAIALTGTMTALDQSGAVVGVHNATDHITTIQTTDQSEKFTLKVEATWADADSYRVGDKIEYTWFRQIVDSHKEEQITADMVDNKGPIAELNNNILVVRTEDPDVQCIYYCKIKNTIETSIGNSVNESPVRHTFILE